MKATFTVETTSRRFLKQVFHGEFQEIMTLASREVLSTNLREVYAYPSNPG
jgi:hypothetical protein